MSFHTTLVIYMAFRCMWYAPKLSILTQLTYFRVTVTVPSYQALVASLAC